MARSFFQQDLRLGGGLPGERVVRGRPDLGQVGPVEALVRVGFHESVDQPTDAHGRISKRTAQLKGVSVTEVTFGVGARWSQDLKEFAGTELCELPHVALVQQGTLRVVLGDGSQEDFSAGDVRLLSPGYDAWAVGERRASRRVLPRQRLLRPSRRLSRR